MNNELKHYGVLGMKWGVRKDRSSSAARRKAKTRGWSKDAKEVNRIKSKKVSTLTNAELRKANDRMNLERTYKSLNRTKMEKGLAFVSTLAVTSSSIITLHNNSAKLVSNGKKFVKFIKKG